MQICFALSFALPLYWLIVDRGEAFTGHGSPEATLQEELWSKESLKNSRCTKNARKECSRKSGIRR
jgi:hypothetical protein